MVRTFARWGWRLVLCAAGVATPALAPAATLFGLVDTGELYASTDQGVTWSPRSTLPVHDAVALAAGANASQLMLASASGSIYRSTDAGTSWTAVGTISASDVVDLLIRPDLSQIALTTTGSIYRSIDQGVTFSGLAALTGSDFASLAQTATLNLYALARSGGVYESTDAGTSWTAKGAFTAPDAIELRAVGGWLYALTSAGDVYRSVDAAANWTPVGTLSQVGMTGMARDGSTLLATTSAGEVATSSDGTSWTWRGVINQLTVRALATDAPATTDVSEGSAATLELSAPRPNPAVGEAAISFTLSAPASVTLRVHDVAGRIVRTLAQGPYAPGTWTVTWDGRTDRGVAAAAGVYLVKLNGPAATISRRLALLH